ncbi:MAG: HisA/HisF-related TIM barrel protein [Gammaproteobacteria bacterium]|jgi:phosphoribosylformimino-5-aminoimidazole carboxamide ribotide isomerase
MLLIPAIELNGGKCVRPSPGGKSSRVVAEDPVALAEPWVEAGARRLQVMSRDGAADLAAIRSIARRWPELEIQIGGEIREEEQVQDCLDAGARYVIIGTRAAHTPHFVKDLCLEYPGHVIVALDAREGRLATDGWSKMSNQDINDLARHYEEDGVAEIIYTDVGRDGTLSGVDVEGAVQLARSVNTPVYASGGVAGINDIEALAGMTGEGIGGAILGRALYEGKLDFAAAQKRIKELGEAD